MHFYLKYISFVLMLILFHLYAMGQKEHLSGTVYERGENNIPLINANVYWAGTTEGTITDENGAFHIHRSPDANNQLVVSYIGYENDTILVENNTTELQIVLSSANTIGEVTVSERVKGSYISKLEPVNTQVISEKGLQQLACCNLSESFENSATVDVHFADAVTGAKQIQMLGLAGVYTQILTENVPTFRGFSSSFGLNYVPGTWMESIQISKGTSSVINGYESITGQINIEYKKPENEGPLFVNLYANSMERLEANVLSSVKLSDRLSTMAMVHGNQLKNKVDKNKDGFLDLPMNEQINVANRWSYEIDGKYHSQLYVSFLNENRQGGQTSYFASEANERNNAYGMQIQNQRLQAYWKNGIFLPFLPNQSIAIINSLTWHDMSSMFGNKNFDGQNRYFYTNIIYQQSLFNTNHNISAGVSINYDQNIEKLNAIELDNEEVVAGIFGQYTFKHLDKTTSILGIRYDHNSLFGHFITPRLHVKQKLSEHTIVRGSFGKGVRSTNVIAENIGLLAEARNMFVADELQPEEAWNYGVHLTHDVHLKNEKEINLSIDFYRTQFENQVVVDVESSSENILVYNLDGKSFSNSFQVEASSEIFPGFDVTAAYRLNDVRVEQFGELKQKPLTSKTKGLLQLSYATKHNVWQFDVTNQFVGESRIPKLDYLPEDLQQGTMSDPFYMLHVQITKRFKYFDVYAGVENLTDFTQDNPIIDPQNPFSETFNSTIVWGPIVGRKIYFGLRYAIE